MHDTTALSDQRNTTVWTQGRLLLGAFLGVSTGISSLYFYSLGPLMKPIAATYGWSRGEASLGPLVGILVGGLARPVIGRVMDRAGPTVVSVAGMIMLSACFAALGLFTGSLFGFLVLTGLLTATSIGTSPLSYTRVLVEHFHRRRGAALAVAVMGTGVGAILIPYLLVPFVAAHGWRSAYLALAIVVAIAVTPVAVLVRGAAADTERARLHRAREPVALMSIVRTRVFVLLGALFFLASLAVFGTTVHFVPMLSDAGLPVAEVGKIGAILGFTILGGRLFTGLLLDRFPADRVTAALFCLSAAAILALGLGGVKAALPAAVAIGLGMGAEVDLLAYLIARHFPPSAFGTAYGGIYGLLNIGAAIGPAAIGLIYDRTHGYSVPMVVAAISLIFAALLALALDRPRLAPRYEAAAPQHA
jgi:MFS family permease